MGFIKLKFIGLYMALLQDGFRTIERGNECGHCNVAGTWVFMPSFTESKFRTTERFSTQPKGRRSLSPASLCKHDFCAFCECGLVYVL